MIPLITGTTENPG